MRRGAAAGQRSTPAHRPQLCDHSRSPPAACVRLSTPAVCGQPFWREFCPPALYNARSVVTLKSARDHLEKSPRRRDERGPGRTVGERPARGWPGAQAERRLSNGHKGKAGARGESPRAARPGGPKVQDRMTRREGSPAWLKKLSKYGGMSRPSHQERKVRRDKELAGSWKQRTGDHRVNR